MISAGVCDSIWSARLPASSSYRIVPSEWDVRRGREGQSCAPAPGWRIPGCGRADRRGLGGVAVKVRAQDTGHAEVEQLGDAFGGDEDVRRLQIAVNDEAAVRVGHRIRGCGGRARNARGR